jgi:hypothetical protein
VRTNRVIAWLLIGVLIRLVLMPLSMHADPEFIGDIFWMNQRAFFYFSSATPPADLPPPLYPPLAYATMSFFTSLFQPLMPSLSHIPILGEQAGSAWLSSAHLFRHLFLLKIWYLPFDLGIAFLLPRLVSTERKSVLAFKFWMLNPVVVYDAYIHGQFDLVPAFFTVLSLYCLKKQKFAWTMFWLGVSGSYKNYSILFILPAAFILARPAGKRLRYVLLGIAPYLLSLLLLPKLALEGHHQHTLFYSESLFPLRYSVGRDQVIHIFFIVYAILIWYLAARRPHPGSLWRYMFIILSLYYAQAVFDLHYLTWIMPFAALLFVENRKVMVPYLVILACIVVLYFKIPLGLFFLPIEPDFFSKLPSVYELLSPYLPMSLIIDVARCGWRTAYSDR